MWSDPYYYPGPLNYNVTYYWQIIAKDNFDANTTGPVWNFTTKSENNPSDGIFTLDVGAFAVQEELYRGSVELRIPLQKGEFEYLIEPINYDIPPKNQYKTNEHFILYWGEDIEQAIHLEYTYEFNLNEFIYHHPLEMMVVAGILGVVLTIIVEKIINRYKKTDKKE